MYKKQKHIDTTTCACLVPFILAPALTPCNVSTYQPGSRRFFSSRGLENILHGLLLDPLRRGIEPLHLLGRQAPPQGPQVLSRLRERLHPDDWDGALAHAPVQRHLRHGLAAGARDLAQCGEERAHRRQHAAEYDASRPGGDVARVVFPCVVDWRSFMVSARRSELGKLGRASLEEVLTKPPNLGTSRRHVIQKPRSGRPFYVLFVKNP